MSPLAKAVYRVLRKRTRLPDARITYKELAARLRETSDLERLAGRAAAGQATLDDLHALAGVAERLPLLARATSVSRSPFLRALGRPRPGLAAFAERARELLAAPGAARVRWR